MILVIVGDCLSIHSFSKVEKVRAYEKVVEQIVRMITSGEIKPGDKFPAERELAVKLDISRPILRESFRVMESLGIIKSITGSGRYLREADARIFSLAEGQEHLALYLSFMQARTVIEVGTATLACVNAQEVDIDRLRRTAEVPLTAKNFIHADTAFHIAIAEASKNPVLEWIMGSQLFSIYFTSASGSSEQRWDEVTSEHMAIYTAIAQRDAKQAEQAILYHLKKVVENVVQRT